MARRESQEAQLLRRGKEIARQFAVALIAGDLAAAYALTSRRLRRRLASKPFAAEHQTEQLSALAEEAA